LFSIKNNEIYWIFVKNKQIKPIILYSLGTLFDISDDHWADVFNIQKCVRNTKIKTFQYKLLFNLIPCNSYLKRIKRSDTDKCQFCMKWDDNIHYMYGCENTLTFWKSFKTWWYNLTGGEDIQINKTTVILGFIDNSKQRIALNACILFGKWHVYRSKLNQLPPFFYKYLCSLKYNLVIEKTIALKNNKLAQYNQIWQEIENHIT
jgi:hypothetical protein